MIIVYLGVAVFYLVLFLLSAKEQIPVNQRGEKIFLGKAAAFLYGKLADKKIFRCDAAKENLKLLQPGTAGKKEKEEAALRYFNIKRIGQTLMLILIGDILALCIFISGSMENAVSEGRYIYRNPYGEGEIQALLEAKVDRKGGDEGNSTQEFALKIQEKRLEEIRVKELAKEIKELLPEMVLGENTSIEEIRKDLNLPDQIEGYPFQLSWESSNYTILFSDGSVTNREMEEHGEIVDLTAILTYGDYREEFVFPVCILPPEYSEEEQLRNKIMDLLISREAETLYEEQIQLPDNVEGVALSWKEKKEDSSGYLFFLICICGALIYLLQEKDLKDRVEQRNRQMLLDYPKLVSKMTLYMGAGMTIRNAFRKIAFDYKKERQQGGKYRYVYEEMLLACYELDSGIFESVVYRQFGKRCRLSQYTKLAGLLVQNLKKGSNSLGEALRQEAQNAFEERRNTARKLGEEAGTKLLLPMMLMLGIVMILILIPAYFSFSL